MKNKIFSVLWRSAKLPKHLKHKKAEGRETRATFNPQEALIQKNFYEAGFYTVYQEFPFNYMMVNKEKLQLMSYTEGDIYLTKCKTKNAFLRELKDTLRFLKNYNSSLLKEMKEELKELNLLELI